MTAQNNVQTWTKGRLAGVSGLLAVWFAAAYVIGTGHYLTNDQNSFFAPVALAVAVPVAAFLSFYWLSANFRNFILSLDIRTLTMIQHWRVIGFGFLPLYAFGVLPGLFAWPAGLGDVAIGLVAIVMIARIDRDPEFALSKRLVRFHLLGLLDFIVAVVTAGLTAGAFPTLIANGVTSAPMDVWPLNIFPSFLVPLFIISHLIVVLKVSHLRRMARDPVGVDQSHTLIFK